MPKSPCNGCHIRGVNGQPCLKVLVMVAILGVLTDSHA